MMNVDYAIVKCVAEDRCCDLHVTRKNQEIDIVFMEQSHLFLFLFGF